jgi:pilus assembly protein CpaC
MSSFVLYFRRHRFLTISVSCALLLGVAMTVGFADSQLSSSKGQPQVVKVSIGQTISLDFSTPVKRTAVANDKVASVSVLSPKALLITGKTFGFTQLMIWDDSGNQMLYDIRVDVDMTRLEATIRDAAPRARVKVTTLLDSVILSGVVPDAPTAERIVDLAKIFAMKVQNQLTVAGTQQVLLRATVAEVSKTAIRALGLNGTFFGADAFGGSNLNGINPTSIGLQQWRLLPIDTPNQFQVTNGEMIVNPTTTLYFGLPKSQMELFLQAMRENRLVKVLAEPNIVAISGQQAEFLAGGELPVPTPSENGIAITFREYGIRLKFTPTVQAGQMIRLTVLSEVSEPDYTNAVQISGLTIPGISKRKAQTVVEIGSGHTFAIAGLLSDNLRGIVNRVPGAGDIPILGGLFRSVRYERAETELVILITPDLASPLQSNEVDALPGKDMAAVSDWQLYGMGMLETDEGAKAENVESNIPQPDYVPPAPLCGPWGMQKNNGSGK